jgi:mono/diheme cytochrome c family protein
VLRALVFMVGVAAAAAGPQPARAADGSGLFIQNCLMCHQSGAVGLPGQFPRLAGRIAAISSQPKGRAYLIDVLTYGMAGKITVDDQSIVGLMPPFAQLSNDDVAGVLSYIQSLDVSPGGDPLGGTPPGSTPPAGTSRAAAPPVFTAREVQAGRSATTVKSATDVRAERQSLEDAKIIQ